jgi:hypothetical protein
MKWPLHERYAFPGSKNKEKVTRQATDEEEGQNNGISLLLKSIKEINSKWVKLRVLLLLIAKGPFRVCKTGSSIANTSVALSRSAPQGTVSALPRYEEIIDDLKDFLIVS